MPNFLIISSIMVNAFKLIINSIDDMIAVGKCAFL